jgi:hypothetical protein
MEKNAIFSQVLRRPEVAVALVGGKTPEQVEANTRYVRPFCLLLLPSPSPACLSDCTLC